MKATEFTSKVKETFLKYFPEGFAGSSKYSLSNGGFFSFGLISDAKDCSGGYRANDVISLTIDIHKNFEYGTDTEITEKLVLEFKQNSISTKPEQGSYLAMGRVKIPVRKITNTPEKALETLDKYFKATAELVKAEVLNNNLYGQERIKEKYLNSIK